ncbi:MAG TPA: hypothetical protein VN041_02920 [Microbacterium sp.]|nr:hypothetical protein [Microbacterium sp.]
MTDVRVQLKLRGINHVMTSPGAVAAVVAAANSIQREAGPEFEVNVVPHRYTARAFVRAKSAKGRRQEARDKVLTKAVGHAGR